VLEARRTDTDVEVELTEAEERLVEEAAPGIYEEAAAEAQIDAYEDRMAYDKWGPDV